MRPRLIADVAVDQQHERHLLREGARQRGADAGGDRVQARMRRDRRARERRARPGSRLPRGRTASSARAHLGGDGVGVEIASARREIARDHRQVLQRQLVAIGDQDGVAADLHRELRGADDGGADALAGVPDRRQVAAVRQRMAQRLGEIEAEIAEVSASRACRDIRRRRPRTSWRRSSLLASAAGQASVTSRRCASSPGARRSIMPMTSRAMRSTMRFWSAAASGLPSASVDAERLARPPSPAARCA